MKLRGPATPRLVLLATLLLVYDTIGTTAMQAWYRSLPGSTGLPVGLIWFGLNSLAYGAPLLAMPLLKWLPASTAEDLRSNGWRWVAFYLLFLSAGALGCGARAVLAIQWFGVQGDPRINLLLYLGPLPWIAMMVHYAEREAAFQRSYLMQEDTIERKIEQLFLSRASLLKLRARTAYEVLRILSDQVAPPLTRLQHQIDGLASLARAGSLPRDAVLGTLQDELDAICDEQVRQISHILHPSVIKLGLLPALVSLARTYQDRIGVTVEAAEGVRALDDTYVGVLSEALQLNAYRIIEAVLDNVAHQTEASSALITLDTARGWLEVLVAYDGGGFEAGTASDGMAQAVIDSRVTLAGGSWKVESAPTTGTRLQIRLPIVRVEATHQPGALTA